MQIHGFQHTDPLTHHMNDRERPSRAHFVAVVADRILLRPFIKSTILTARVIKLITWDAVKTGIYAVSKKGPDASLYFEGEYLKTVKAFRDFVFMPSLVARAFTDLFAKHEPFVDDLPRKKPDELINGEFDKSFKAFSSPMHGTSTFQVLVPKDIKEIPAVLDPTLKTIAASSLFKKDMLAINFGNPNVATFITEEKDNAIQITKVDAKSLKREPMKFEDTKGKVQSGVFLIPTNLPKEALERFQTAAKKLVGTSDITCVNTNCKVLKEAGFSIEGVSLDGVIFPGTLMQHLVYRNVFYKDASGVNHKVHFEIVNTTPHQLEKYFEIVDTSVVGTRLRHKRRNAATDEDKKVRGTAAQALLELEKARLAAIPEEDRSQDESSESRKITVSVPSYIGEFAARIWGRHTMYELDLTDKKEEIAKAFQDLPAVSMNEQEAKLAAFAHKNPSLLTRLKKHIFFSHPMIRFLRSQMMGRSDVIHLHTKDIFKHLESTKGVHLNYVVLDDKLVLARVVSTANSDEAYKNAADWALSKHALLAGRQKAYCSGELWYDAAEECYKINGDSGTYTPDSARVTLVVDLANKIFNTEGKKKTFKVAGA
ncbi:MAG: hypothetical protein LLF94_11385 [Chlamydiales bacterium]|nr:hypothetical protein [Chlamydiales bacterium]